MSRKKQETLAIFREGFELTEKLSNAQFGEIFKAVCAYRFRGEVIESEDPAVMMGIAFLTAQVDRYEEFCRQKREQAYHRYHRKEAERMEENTPEEAYPIPEEECPRIDCEDPRTEEEFTQWEEERERSAAADPSTSTSMSTSMSSSISTSMSPSASLSISTSELKKRACANTIPGAHTHFLPPGKEEVAAYCRELGLGIDPERFWEYYSARGWQISGQPVYDWRAALRSWQRMEVKNGTIANKPAWKIGTRL